MSKKLIGVLGGMGPDATALFFSKIIKFTPAVCDQEHIPMIIYNNPQIPDRTKSILGNGKVPIEALKSSLTLLEKTNPAFICIPCNTVHHYFKEMQESTSIPIVSLVDSVVEYVTTHHPSLKKVGLLATIGTIRARLYEIAFAKNKIQVIAPEKNESEAIQKIIQDLKGHSRDATEIQRLAVNLVKAGAEGVILGCTELSLIAERLSLQVPVFDSIDILAEKAVRLALD